MTCIAAIVNKESRTVWMMGDTQRTSDTVISGERGPKITQMIIGGHACLVGQAGAARAMQLIWHAQDLQAETCSIEQLPMYLVTKWIPCVHELLEDHGQIASPCPGAFAEAKNHLLIAFPHAIFLLGNGFEIGQIDRSYEAIGEGASYVFGSLGTTEGMSLSPQDRLQKALQVASDHSTVVSAPFTLRELKG